jgi:DNA-directed RNA polymerase specialized sigma24 family protein
MTTQDERYGELLTNEECYRADISCFVRDARLTEEQERALAEQARAGDETSRQEIITHLLPSIERVASGLYGAYRWASHRIEYLDLIQEGNEAMLQRFDQVLQLENPIPYLVVVARHAMYAYCRRNSSAILTPRMAKPLAVFSLDAPLEEDADATWMDLLEAPRTQDTPENEQDSHLIQEAIHALPEPEQAVILHGFGLFEHERMRTHELGHSRGWEEEEIQEKKRMAFYRLYCRLSASYPAYASDGVLPVQPCAIYPTVAEADQATRERKRRLDQAYEKLMRAEGKVSHERLVKVSKVRSLVVSVYLRARRGLPQVALSQHERLQRAYAAAVARGETWITATMLAQEAHVDLHVALPWWRERRPQLSKQERLEQAHQRLLARGEKVSYKTLLKEARMDERVVRDYLRVLPKPEKPTIKERIAQAYALLEAQGEKITVRTLSTAAHIDGHKVADYLRERRSKEPSEDALCAAD